MQNSKYLNKNREIIEELLWAIMKKKNVFEKKKSYRRTETLLNLVIEVEPNFRQVYFKVEMTCAKLEQTFHRIFIDFCQLWLFAKDIPTLAFYLANVKIATSTIKFCNVLRHKFGSSLHLLCAYSKNPMCYSDRLFQNFKIGAHSWDQLFSVHFFVRNMRKVVPLPKKN